MRLLLIEDDSRIARFITRGLEAERYATDVAPDGEQGIEMAQAGIYDLILLDLVLPGIDGIQVCRQLRAQQIRVPILILTAKDSVEDTVTGLEAGADDYLTKPFAFEELVARIHALLRRPAAVRPERTLEVADLTLDGRAHEAKRAGQLLDLTPKEFSLLEYLMSHPGRVLSRTLIEEHVWGYHHDPLTNVVDVYIRRLRQKVDQPFPHPLIHTIRGVGYTLKP